MTGAGLVKQREETFNALQNQQTGSSLEFVIDGVNEKVGLTAWGGTDPVKLPSGQEYRALCKRMNAAGELP